MISYDTTGLRLPMRVLRFRRLGQFALLAYPAGFALTCLGPSGSGPFIAGMALVLAGFAATIVLIGTGINQVASGTGAGLDEFELAARLQAHSDAYRWFGAFVSASLSAAMIAQLFGVTLDTGSDRFFAYFLWVIGYGALLPGWFLAQRLRADPDPAD